MLKKKIPIIDSDEAKISVLSLFEDYEIQIHTFIFQK